ncbi:MerR family transcriptional regulator [Salinibacterium sp. NSLL150]|uniref:MerR family transcriptional regulator n=1 Tax=unclassified Salinibacterium TaxID=2632331 RepID=UPI0018CE4EAF|nr:MULTISPECIES: MerR family transcriptional regulator [unclassified Salinibacterium]MBH0099757.1 MerR family transcriptional regulator [Salinibacterium sp. NSLL35]MBH0102511.1 MerR family transcriptional regulator [Salinibacterium sp. NSLL150]MBH0105271.1 MerR family transcriptional regulator [Salinibacterium sp. NSLL16]MBH0108031.1 MerR family transcriptional regulator [Salinibacterium sp. NSLL17]MBH0110797.1 MerR family transcriptional regulator [Salinibacterium sp. NG22]
MTTTNERVLTIGEVAEATGVTDHTLRYYEKAGLLVVPRLANGQRRYREMDVKAVEFIGHLRRTGMPIRTIREYADLVRSGKDTAAERMRLLEQHRENVIRDLAEQQKHLDGITLKIEWYRAAMDQRENSGAQFSESLASTAIAP